jgi:hypothetical protein
MQLLTLPRLFSLAIEPEVIATEYMIKAISPLGLREVIAIPLK